MGVEGEAGRHPTAAVMVFPGYGMMLVGTRRELILTANTLSKLV